MNLFKAVQTRAEMEEEMPGEYPVQPVRVKCSSVWCPALADKWDYEKCRWMKVSAHFFRVRERDALANLILDHQQCNKHSKNKDMEKMVPCNNWFNWFKEIGEQVVLGHINLKKGKHPKQHVKLNAILPLPVCSLFSGTRGVLQDPHRNFQTEKSVLERRGWCHSGIQTIRDAAVTAT